MRSFQGAAGTAESANEGAEPQKGAETKRRCTHDDAWCKGLEFRAVFLPSGGGIVPHEKGMDTVAEERRLFYVAMTRASEKLCLSAILQRYEKERKPSRFLAEMGLDAEMAFRKNKEKEGNKR